MRTDRDSDLRDDQEGPANRLRGLARRMAVKLVGATSNLWQLLGFQGAYGEDETVPDVEAFQNIGFASKPKAGSEGAEAVVISIGAQSGHSVIVATRDRSIEFDLADDETAIFNSTGARIHLLADGSVVVRAAPGRTVSVDDGAGAEPLVTRAEFLSHGHPTAGTGAVSPPIIAPAPGSAVTFPGTVVLKGK